MAGTELGSPQLLCPGSPQKLEPAGSVQVDRREMGKFSIEERYLGNVEPGNWSGLWCKKVGNVYKRYRYHVQAQVNVILCELIYQ